MKRWLSCMRVSEQRLQKGSENFSSFDWETSILEGAAHCCCLQCISVNWSAQFPLYPRAGIPSGKGQFRDIPSLTKRSHVTSGPKPQNVHHCNIPMDTLKQICFTGFEMYKAIHFLHKY